MKLLTPKQAAEKLGITPGTLANWRTQGKGPKFRRVGGWTIFYSLKDIKRFKKAC